TSVGLWRSSPARKPDGSLERCCMSMAVPTASNRGGRRRVTFTTGSSPPVERAIRSELRHRHLGRPAAVCHCRSQRGTQPDPPFDHVGHLQPGSGFTLDGLIPPETVTQGKPTVNPCFYYVGIKGHQYVTPFGSKTYCQPSS